MKLENNGKALPILSFPCTSLMGVKTDELVHSAELQAKGMKAVADRTDAAASVSMMDLSVEAEAFGAEVRFSPDEVPSVIGALVGSSESAERLAVPVVGTARTGVFVKSLGTVE